MGIEIVSNNIMLVNGELLQAETTSAEEFRQILILGRGAIIQAIDAMYAKYSKLDAIVQRGSVWVMKLDDSANAALSPAGHREFERRRTIGNAGIYSDAKSIYPRYLPYWQAVAKVGLIPEARATDDHIFKTGSHALFLLARDSELKLV